MLLFNNIRNPVGWLVTACFNPCFNGCYSSTRFIFIILMDLKLVSILVLMDVTLQLIGVGYNIMMILVSILVLMDVTLQQRARKRRKWNYECFNPCFNGCYSSTNVLIYGDQIVISFNPCFNGCYSSTYTWRITDCNGNMFQSLF